MNKELAKLIKYPVAGVMLTQDKDFEEKETGNVRKRSFFAWLPVYLGAPKFIPLSGCQFTWFQNVTIWEKEILTRYTEFDSGLTYQSYWSEWKSDWIVIGINK